MKMLVREVVRMVVECGGGSGGEGGSGGDGEVMIDFKLFNKGFDFSHTNRLTNRHL